MIDYLFVSVNKNWGVQWDSNPHLPISQIGDLNQLVYEHHYRDAAGLSVTYQQLGNEMALGVGFEPTVLFTAAD